MLGAKANGLQDANLKRCFGVDKMIKDCEWEDLRALRTVRKPSEGMPRLKDLLVWLNESARDDIWIVLDIKVISNARSSPAEFASLTLIDR